MIAFFDLDRTLLSVNSGSLWVRRELRLGHASRFDALRASIWLAGYHLGVAPMDDIIRTAIGRLAGTPRDALVERTRAFYAEEVRGRWRPSVPAVIAAHRARGEACVILTGSSGYLSELVMAELGLDHSLCNRFEVDAHGLHTGAPTATICYGAGKVVHAEAYVRERGVSLDACAFYTDSYTDLPVLERVGRPVAVHPDPRLARVARKRGWRIEEWSGETPRAV